MASLDLTGGDSRGIGGAVTIVHKGNGGVSKKDLQDEDVRYQVKYELEGKTYPFGMLWGTGNPDSDTEYADWCYGSLFFDLTNGAVYVKTAAGGTSTWTALTIN